MKKLLLFAFFACISASGFAQKQLLSYEDIKYLLENNLQRADTFFEAKGYTIDPKTKKNIKKYALAAGGTHTDVKMRLDGRRMFIDIETNELNQYNLIYNSISDYVTQDTTLGADVKSYKIKDLGNIYITVSDSRPYNPLKRDYDIHIIGENKITIYN
jgi:hypothetical protein